MRPIVYALPWRHWKTAPRRDEGVWADVFSEPLTLRAPRRANGLTPLDQVRQGKQSRQELSLKGHPDQSSDELVGRGPSARILSLGETDSTHTQDVVDSPRLVPKQGVEDCDGDAHIGRCGARQPDWSASVLAHQQWMGGADSLIREAPLASALSNDS